MRTGHLFAGAGGGLLADLILGHEPVFAVEWDRYACQILRERAGDGWFPGLRVHEGDVRLFDPSDYAGRVDCIHAGFPCQDISVAGKQAGVGADTRSGLYREVLRIADVVRPRFLFLENVSAILSNGLGTVLGDLAARGYDCRWTCIRAADVGAPHLRDRWWCLADSDGATGTRSTGTAFLPRELLDETGREEASDRSCSGGERAGGMCHKCERFFARFRCGAAEMLECDCPKCQGYCGCSDVADADDARLQGCNGAIVRERADEWPFGAGDTQRIDGQWWESEPDVGRVANELAPQLDGGEKLQEAGQVDDAERDQETGATGGQCCGDGMQQMRFNGTTAPAPSRLHKAAGGGNHLREVPRQGSCDPAVGESQQAAEVRMLRSDVHLQAGEGNDVQSVVRQYAGMAPSWWEVEPDVGRVAHGIQNRVDRLKALGNGQVPLQAALAWRILTD